MIISNFYRLGPLQEKRNTKSPWPFIGPLACTQGEGSNEIGRTEASNWMKDKAHGMAWQTWAWWGNAAFSLLQILPEQNYPRVVKRPTGFSALCPWKDSGVRVMVPTFFRFVAASGKESFLHVLALRVNLEHPKSSLTIISSLNIVMASIGKALRPFSRAALRSQCRVSPQLVRASPQ